APGPCGVHGPGPARHSLDSRRTPPWSGPSAATRRPPPPWPGPPSRPGPAAWRPRHYCVDPPGASCLADVTHPQDMRGPRSVLAAPTSPSAAPWPTFHGEEPVKDQLQGGANVIDDLAKDLRQLDFFPILASTQM